MIYWQLLGLAVALNMVGFVIAYARRSDKLTDFSYGLTFFLIALFGLLSGDKTSPAWLLFVILALWSIRIGGFLLLRVLVKKKDKRFDGVRESFWKFGRFWLLQGIAAWVIMLPSIYVLYNSPASFQLVAIIGAVIASSGLLIETIADTQKFRFGQNPKNKGRFITGGLWKYSRHPNYFGEILVWLGAYIYAYPYLNFGQKVIFSASPIAISYILIFVTGMPKLETYADEKWGGEKAYQDYKAKTSSLIILPPKN